MKIRFLACLLPLALALPAAAQQKVGPDPAEVAKVVDKAIAYLKTQQNADGSFAPKLAGPGVGALVAASLSRHGVSPNDPVLQKTLAFLESSIQKDGGVYSKGLANYTTSVAIMAFKEANNNGKYDTAIKNANKFIVSLQNTGEGTPAFGGFSYDGKGKPDMSNTGFALEALIAAGLSKDDPAVQRTLKFLGNSQNLPGETNAQAFAKKTTEEDKGGFVYNPLNAEDSKHRTPEGGLRSVGAMTYSGLKSFLYAGVSKDDPRVKAAIDWIRRHYTVDENVNLGQAGLYYYYHTFSKAMHAWGEDQFADAKNVKHDWRKELFEALKKRQEPDGSWRNDGDRTFGESNSELATAFALLSLSYVK